MNPVLDQDRAQLVATRAEGAPRQLLPQWLRPEKELPVVSLEVDWVRFSILNHRTRAEQIRVTRQPGKEDVFTDPFSDAAQTEQYNILIKQAHADDLFDDLAKRGQREPAVITADGVLINGNRRGAALRKLYVEDDKQDARYIRAFVLPNDVTAQEILDLETELQVSRDYRQQYSWVNEGFLIEDIFEASGKDWAKVAKRVRLKQDEARKIYTQLQQLHQLVEMSGGALDYTNFEDKESPFTELSAYVSNKTPQETKVVRDSFFLGVISDANYRDLRKLRRPDADTFIESEFQKEPVLAKLMELAKGEATVNPDEADDLLDDVLGTQETGASGVSAVLSFLATKNKDEMISLPGGDSVQVDNLLETVKEAVTVAANEADEDTKDSKAVNAPLQRLDAAIRDAGRSLSILAQARSFDEFDEAGFVDRVSQLREIVEQLEQK